MCLAFSSMESKDLKTFCHLKLVQFHTISPFMRRRLYSTVNNHYKNGRFLYFLHYTLHVIDPYSYIEDESRDRSESLYVDHGQSVWKVTLTRAHKEQPEHNKHALR